MWHLIFVTGYKDDNSNFVLPTSRKTLSEEEEAEQFIIDTLRSQKEFEGMNLNQVSLLQTEMNGWKNEAPFYFLFYVFNTFQIKEISQAGRVKHPENQHNTEISREPRFIDFLWLYTSSITETSTVYSKTFTLTITDCKPAAGLTGLVPSSCAAG